MVFVVFEALFQRFPHNFKMSAKESDDKATEEFLAALDEFNPTVRDNLHIAAPLALVEPRTDSHFRPFADSRRRHRAFLGA